MTPAKKTGSDTPNSRSSTKKTSSTRSTSPAKKTSRSKSTTSTKSAAGRKTTTTKQAGTRKTASSSKKRAVKKQSKQSSSGVRLLLIGMFLVGLILIGAIVALDHNAMKKGQVGFWETVSGVKPARTAIDVEALAEQVLSEYGVSSTDLIRKGSTTSAQRDNEKLRHVVYKVPGTNFRSLLSEFEDRARQKGISVHNRHVVKEPEKWVAAFFLGTYTTRTHKLELISFPSGTPTPAPIPEKYLNIPEVTPEERPENTPAETNQSTDKIPSRTTKAMDDDAPRVALVFDDFGFDLDIARRFLNEMTVPITLAVIPYQSYSRETIEMTLKARQTPFLHLPMEPSNPSAMGTQPEIFLTTTMDDETLRSKTNEALDLCKGVAGVNNHTGSKLTTDRHRMEIVLTEIKRRNLVFVDSRTIASTIAEEVAHDLGVKAASRKIFIDQGFAGGDVNENMKRLIIEAQKNGSAIGIGHAIGTTLDEVIAALPLLQDAGVKVVPVTDLVY